MNPYRRLFLMFTLITLMLSPVAYAQYRVPAKEKIPVAFVITDHAVTIDFCRAMGGI
jgi:hypothetical protein